MSRSGKQVTAKQVTQYTITGHPSLDPVRVIFEDVAPGAGRLTVGCYGESWETFWAAMGDGVTLREFLARADNHYICKNLARGPLITTDWDAISEKIGEDVGSEEDIELLPSGVMVNAYGDDWYMDLPTTDSNEMVYLNRIVTAVRDALLGRVR